MLARRLSCAALLSAAVACSWTRFDDITEDTPVLVLRRPDTISGFGSWLAPLRDGPRTLLAVGGAPRTASGVALFNLGDGQSPALDAFDIGCQSAGCFVAGSGAALPVSKLAAGPCFVAGVAEGLAPGDGAYVRCHRTGEKPLETRLPLPADVDQAPAADHAVRFASDPEPQPAVLGSVPTLARAWVWSPVDQAIVDLQPPTPTPSLGASLAVLRAGAARRFAVGAPDAGKVWLFDETGTATACLSGPALGRALASGPVDLEAGDDLVVSGDFDDAGKPVEAVFVVPGSTLLSLAPSNASDCFDVTSLAGMQRLSCRTSPDVTRCTGFGAALAVGDIDADGDGEVAVGAPRATVRDNADAGAVFVYDLEGNFANFPTETRFIASAEQGDLLGASLVMAPRSAGALLVAGAPSGGKVALFFCSKLLKPEQRGARCD